MHEEESSASTVLIVVGGVGCLVLVLAALGALFLGTRVSPGPMPGPTPMGATTSTSADGSTVTETVREDLGNGGFSEIETKRVNGVLTERTRTNTIAGGVQELRARWGDAGEFDEEASGLFVAGTRERGLNDGERESLTRDD